MQVNSEVLDQKGGHKPDDVLVENGLLKQLTKALLQYTLNTQSTPVRQDLGHPRFAGFDDKIVSMFARGASESGPSLISEATSVLALQLSALRSKRLDPCIRSSVWIQSMSSSSAPSAQFPSAELR